MVLLYPTPYHTKCCRCKRDLGSLSHGPPHPRMPTYTHHHTPSPVVKDKSTCHSTQEQDDGQVELELLILILVGKSAVTDTPRKGHITIAHLGEGP